LFLDQGICVIDMFSTSPPRSRLGGGAEPSSPRAADAIEENGDTIVDDVVHGYGGGSPPPVLRTPGQPCRTSC
jgi:hypothetical protein